MNKSIDIDELKKIELELLVRLDEYCSANGLRYYITYGTLIGAVRHKGFIPWDDDIDVIMPRKDYEILISSFNENSDSQNVRLVSSKLSRDYYLPIAKLIDTRTILKEKTDVDVEIGVYIDIFPLDNLADNYASAVKRIQKGFRYNQQWMIKTISIDPARRWYKNLILYLGKALLKQYSIRDIILQMDEFCRETEKPDFTEYVGVICGISAGDETRVFKREWFESTIKLVFEGREFTAPAGYDILLKQLYGDYMQLPPVDKQESHHAFEAWYK